MNSVFEDFDAETEQDAAINVTTNPSAKPMGTAASSLRNGPRILCARNQFANTGRVSAKIITPVTDVANTTVRSSAPC